MTINTGDEAGKDSQPKATAHAIGSALGRSGGTMDPDTRRDLELQAMGAEAQARAEHSARLKALRPNGEFRSPGVHIGGRNVSRNPTSGSPER
jgi:hypothetical protein